MNSASTDVWKRLLNLRPGATIHLPKDEAEELFYWQTPEREARDVRAICRQFDCVIEYNAAIMQYAVTKNK